MNTLELLAELRIDLSKVKKRTWDVKLYKFRNGYISKQGGKTFDYPPFLFLEEDYTKNFNGTIKYKESAVTKIKNFLHKYKNYID